MKDSDLELLALRSFAHRIDAGDPAAHNNLGVVYHRRKMPVEAEAMFRRAVELDSGFAVAWRNLAAVSPDRGPQVESHLEFFPPLPTLLQASLQESGLADGFRARVPGEAGSLDNRPLLADAHSEAVVNARLDAVRLRRAAESSQAAGRTLEAIRMYREALALDPADSSAQLSLAMLLAAESAHEEAIASLVELLDSDPYNVPALAALAALLERLDRHSDARVAYSRVIRFDPTHTEATAYFERRDPAARSRP